MNRQRIRFLALILSASLLSQSASADFRLLSGLNEPNGQNGLNGLNGQNGQNGPNGLSAVYSEQALARALDWSKHAMFRHSFEARRYAGRLTAISMRAGSRIGRYLPSYRPISIEVQLPSFAPKPAGAAEMLGSGHRALQSHLPFFAYEDHPPSQREPMPAPVFSVHHDGSLDLGSGGGASSWKSMPLGPGLHSRSNQINLEVRRELEKGLRQARERGLFGVMEVAQEMPIVDKYGKKMKRAGPGGGGQGVF
ncbi:MAG TPA: hypothetical protein VMU17_07285, partial [Elusimicrobiota bacterium]|nr:hypothetical protein [Elusimicrobiota bacterium]